jgi:hypothetical protein
VDLWCTLAAIDKAFTISLPLNDIDALNVMAKDFETYGSEELHGCITAVDGWVARTRKPFVTEVTDVMSYRNRHDCWAILVLAGSDAKCRFTMFSCMSSGSTNDCIAWDLCGLKRQISNGMLPKQFYIIGDEAFICTEQFLVPYSGRGLDTWKGKSEICVCEQYVKLIYSILIIYIY